MELKKYFSKDTVIGRTVRTFLQALIGITAFLLGLAAIPGVNEYLVSNSVVATGTLALVISVATYVYNMAERFIKYLKEDN